MNIAAWRPLQRVLAASVIFAGTAAKETSLYKNETPDVTQLPSMP